MRYSHLSPTQALAWIARVLKDQLNKGLLQIDFNGPYYGDNLWGFLFPISLVDREFEHQVRGCLLKLKDNLPEALEFVDRLGRKTFREELHGQPRNIACSSWAKA